MRPARILFTATIFVFLECPSAQIAGVLDAAQTPTSASPPAASPAPKADYFSGVVIAFDSASISVRRKALNADPIARSFLLDAATHVEGKLKLKARVTVRFVSGDDGDRAIGIIVRPDNPPPTAPKKP